MVTIPVKPALPAREQQLLAQGWIKRTITGEPRLSEIVDCYRQLGYEVEVIDCNGADNASVCTACYPEAGAATEALSAVFVRNQAAPKADGEELF